MDDFDGTQGVEDTRSRNRRRSIIVLALLLFVVAAATVFTFLRGQRLDPIPPPPAATSVDDLPVSRLNLRIRYSADRLEADLARFVPETFGSLDERRAHPTIPRVEYAVAARRDDLQVEAGDGALHVTVVVAYQGRVWIDSPFGPEITATCAVQDAGSDAWPRARVRLRASVAVEEGWRLRPDIAIEDVEPATDGERDRCRVSAPPLSMDVTDAVLASVRTEMEAQVGLAEDLLASVDLRAAVQDAWTRLAEPVRLAPDVWLVLHPESIQRGSLAAGSRPGDALEIRVSVAARPRFVVSDTPPDNSPLVGAPPVGEGPVDERFTALIETRLGYGEATRVLERSLPADGILLAGREVRIAEVRVLPVLGDRLAVEVELRGAVRGRLYLVGRPVLDPDRGEITVPDLRFSAETRNILLSSAVWLANTAFADRIQEHARWTVADDLERLRALATEPLDQEVAPGVRLVGFVDRLEMEGIRAAPDGILIRAAVEGEVGIEAGVE